VGLITIAGILGGALLLAFIVLVQRPGVPTGGEGVELTPPTELTPVALADGSTLGQPDAPVAMDVWIDFQCPVCGLFAANSLPSLIRDFVEPGILRLTSHEVAFLDVPPSTESADSAAAAACANEQDAYWPYHDWLFANQSGENQGAYRREVLDSIAARIGLDAGRFASCLDSGTHQTAARAAAGTSGISATPTIRVAGQEFRGVPAYEELAKTINDAAGIQAP
jgi:protein-disulfide isomerase